MLNFIYNPTAGKGKAQRFRKAIEAKLKANAEYADRNEFGRKCLMNVASAAKFSSDRTIRQYAEEIWHVKPTKV